MTKAPKTSHVKDKAVRTATGALDRTEHRVPFWRKLLTVLREDTNGLHPRLLTLNRLAGVLPRFAFDRTRAQLYSLAGFALGPGTTVGASIKINGAANLHSNLSVGRDCSIGADCVFDLEDRITIGNGVTLGRGVMLLTSTHELDIREHRAGAIQLSPVTIGDGAWLGAAVTVLPGVTIGEGAVVEAGSVVNKDVPPRTPVQGIPAMPKKA